MDQEISIKDYVTNSYLVFGKSMNIDRHLPCILDGLKPVYQRLITASFEFKDYIKSATLAGICLGKYHPHGDKSLKKTIARIVNLGLFDGQGNFGYHHMTGEVDEPAAMRYTEIRLKPEIKNQISKFIEFVPKTLSESGYEMPTYIPTPIPFALVGSDQGIAIGINQKIPAFSAKSLLKAYLTDNPEELVSQYGLTINKEKSGLKKLWEEGQGRLFLSMKVTRDGNGATIEGDTTLFTPNLSYLFQEYKWGNVDYQNLSEGVGKLRFSKPARTRKMSVEYIQSLVEEAAKWDSPYYIRVHDETRGFPISMRTWIDVCYKNYSNLIIKGSEVEIGRLERKIKFYTNLNSVYNDLVNTKDSKNDIASKHNIDVGLVKDIASKSADYVRHTNVNEKIHECESKIDFIRSNSVKSQIESYVGVLK